ncbi:DMT family transporter [Catenovulum sp. SM1970]|uniref:DMT family transporter n=1 Tax=Marinifaba aquimaris TaxID=2741323 RepID=UPI0015727DEA|nr:DMT family transporter [Marinifaba aquimaris]NTS78436.1 DMT family transporter [Marinifaba aquimaris]
MKSQKVAITLALGATVLWSTVATAFKLALSEFTPLQLLAIASVTSWCIFLTINLYKKNTLTQLVETFKLNASYLIAASLINPLIYYWVLFQAYDLLPAQIAQSLNYTWSVTFCILSALILKQSIKPIEWIALLLAYFAVFIISSGGTHGDLSLLGISLALGSTLLWSSYWIIKQKIDVPAEQSLLICFSLAAPLLIVLSAIFSPFQLSQFSELKALSSAIYVGFFEMGITFLLWLAALKKAHRPAPIALLIYLSPFISLVLISQILGEQIAPTTLYGLAIIVFALILPKLGKKEDGN